MAYLRPAHECNCEACEGASHRQRHGGEDVIGGWICACRCHSDKNYKRQRRKALKEDLEEIAKAVNIYLANLKKACK